MKNNTYHISGMTCQSCRSKVHKALSAITGVQAIEVDLEQALVSIQSEARLVLKDLNAALPSKYKLSEFVEIQKINEVEESEISKWKQLQPLFLIFGYLLGGSALIQLQRGTWDEFMLDFMGLFYLVFAFFKMLDLKGFPDSFAMYDPLAKRIKVYGKIYPFLETLLGVLLILRIAIVPVLLVTLLILGITTLGVIKVLRDKKSIRCACLGTVLKLPMTEATFIENAMMILMAIAVLIEKL